MMRMEILREKMPKVDEQVLNLPPIRLESLLATGPPSGYHVSDAVTLGIKLSSFADFLGVYCFLP